MSETENATEGEEMANLEAMKDTSQQDEAPAADTTDISSEGSADSDSVQSSIEEKKRDELCLNANGEIYWNDNAIARLLPNQPLFAPKIELIGEELNREETANVVFERLYSWLDEQIRSELFPLSKLKSAIDYVAPNTAAVAADTSPTEQNVEEENCESPAQETEAATDSDTSKASPKTPKLPLSDAALEIAKKIHAANGILDRTNFERDIQALTQDNRRELRNFGVKFGRSAVYLPLLLKPKAAKLNAILNHFAQGKSGEVYLPRMGVTSFNADLDAGEIDYSLVGFKNVGGRVIRLDILDRVIDALFEAAKEAKTAIPMPMAVVSLLGVSNEIAANVVEGLGWEKQADEEGNIKWALPKKRFAPRPPRQDGPRPEQKFEKKFENRSRPNAPQNFSKKKKDKAPPKKRSNDYITREASNVADSPFAILAKLKDNLGN